MFDVGMSELMVVAVVALVVIGPKDLPRTLRALGQMVTRMRGLAGDFSRHFDDMLREADLADTKRQMLDLGSQGADGVIKSVVDPDGAVARGLELLDTDAKDVSSPEEKSGAASDEPETGKPETGAAS